MRDEVDAYLDGMRRGRWVVGRDHWCAYYPSMLRARASRMVAMTDARRRMRIASHEATPLIITGAGSHQLSLSAEAPW